MTNTETVIRCGWVTSDPTYIEYHDNEWGIPVKDGQKLFQMLCLEGQQAGLSWLTILKKRDNYNNLFYNFDPYKIINLADTDIQNLLSNTAIVRHKGKINAIINNAQCFINMEESGIMFSDFMWSFVDNTPIINMWKSMKEVPSETDISKQLSKSLKQHGFKYVGSTICYAFMQACGLVDDHLIDCICRSEIRKRKF